jgi:hypothetical protein
MDKLGIFVVAIGFAMAVWLFMTITGGEISQKRVEMCLREGVTSIESIKACGDSKEEMAKVLKGMKKP